jgi:hypothetical protein
MVDVQMCKSILPLEFPFFFCSEELEEHGLIKRKRGYA